MSLFDHPVVSQRYFFPRSGAPSQGQTTIDVDNIKLRCARFEHDANWPWVIYFHGNGEIVSDYVPEFVQFFKQMQTNSFFAEYRGYGNSDGEPMLAYMLHDACVISDACGVPHHRQIIFGRSIGSIYAIEVASKRAVGGLILESGIADVLERILLRATPEELGTTLQALQADAKAHFDHQHKLSTITQPTLILHAQFDHLVDVSHAERNHQWSASKDKHLVRFPAGDHNSIFYANQNAYTQHVHRFIQSTME